MRYLLLVVACFMPSCPGPVCQKLQTRCANDVVQICDSRGRWQKVIDCREVQPDGWSCVFDGVDHTCIEVVRHEASYNRNDSQSLASYGKNVSVESYQ